MFEFLFKKKINIELLKLAQISYGGELFLGLKNYRLKNINFLGRNINKVPDAILPESFFSYKNEASGFTAVVYEHIKTGAIVIAFRGTERPNLGENKSDLMTFGKDIYTDINLVVSNSDEQYYDAYEFFNTVKSQNKSSKITIIGHSLGGALAQLVGAKVYSDTNYKTKTFTFNAPGCKHLLKVFGCNPKLNYSFIKNYTVMNDWCGMFGEHIGETFLIPPIPISVNNNNSTSEILKNILLTCHEGIFEYSGNIIKKPNNFNQTEGLALWYFDKNNPTKEMETIQAFVNTTVSQTNFPNIDSVSESINNTTEKFMPDSIISTQIKDATDFISEHTSKFMEFFNNNNILGIISQTFEKTLSDISVENLNTSIKVMKELKIDKTQPEYFNYFKEYYERITQ